MFPAPLRLLAAVAIALGGCSREPPAAPAGAATAPVRVRVAAVAREVAPSIVAITGTVRPVERAVIAAKISGTIKALPPTLGQVVKHGELLARLAAPELAARLAQARAQLTQAEREEKRNRELAATGADTADAALAAAERRAVARAAVTEAEAMLAYTEIRAPYDGRIAQKLAYPGDLATPGQPLLVLESSATLRIEAAVPASLAAPLALGTELALQISGAAAPTTGRVVEIAAAADPATRTVLVKLELPSPDPAWSGRAARIELPGPPTEALLVPAACVSVFGQMERVFVVRDGRAQLRLVKTGAMRGDRIELLAGVAAGESVVVAPPGTLRDGAPVTVVP